MMREVLDRLMTPDKPNSIGGGGGGGGGGAN